MDGITRFKKWRKRFRILAVFVLLSTGIFFALVQTPWGKGKVADIVSTQLQEAGIGTAKIESITGLVPFRMRIGRVGISDAEKGWLRIENIYLRLSLAKLFLGRVHINELHIERIALSGFPELEAQEETSWSTPQIPDLPSWLVVERFEIQRLDVGRDVFGREGSFALSGELLQPKRGRGLDLAFHVDRLGEHVSTFSVQLTKEQDSLRLDASLRDGTYLPELLGTTEPVSLAVVGSGPFTDWAGEVEFKTGSDRLGLLEVRLLAGDTLTMSCTGRLQLENAIFPARIPEALGSEVNLEARAVLSAEGLFEVESFVLTSDLAEFRIAGRIELEQQTVDGNALLSHSQFGELIGSPSSMQDKPAKMQVIFKGPLESLEVGLVAWVAEEIVLDGSLALKATAPFRVQGELRHRAESGLWPDGIDALVSDEILLAVDLTYDQNSERLDVETLSVSTQWADLTVEGSASWATKELHAQAKLSVNDAGRLEAILGTEVSGRAEIDLTLNGTALKTDAIVQVTVNDLEIASAYVPSGRMELRATGGDWTEDLATPLAVTVQGSSEAIRFSEYEQPPIRLSMQASFPDTGQLIIEEFAVSDENFSLEGEAFADIGSEKAAVDLRAQIQDLAAVTTLFDLEWSGNAMAEVHAESTEGFEAWQGRIDVQIQDLEELPAVFSELLGEKVRVGASFNYATDTLKVSALEVLAEHAGLSGSGEFDVGSREVRATGKLTLPDLSALADATGLEVSGYAEAEIVAAASPETLDARLEISARDLGIESLHIERAHFVVHANGAPREPWGDFRLNLTENGETILAEGDYRIDESAVLVPRLIIRNRENLIEGSGEFQYAESQGRGNARVTFPDLRSLGEFFHTRVEGSGNAEADFAILEAGSFFKGEIALHEVRSASLGMDDGRIEWDFDNVATSPEGYVEMSATSVEVGESIADSIELTADLRNEAAHVNSQASGSIYAGVPWEVAAEAVLPLGKGRFELTRLDGSVDHYDFHLLDAAALLVSEDEATLEPVRIQVADGTIQGYGKWSDSVLDAHAEWENLPLSAGESFGLPIAQGTLEGELQLSGTPGEPRGELRLTLADLRTHGMLLQPELPSLSGSGRVELYEDRLSLTARIEASPENVLSGEFTLPTSVSFAPFQVDTSEAEEWRGNLALRFNLDLIPALLTSEEFRLEGHIDGNFEVSGTLDSPRIDGTATVEGGRFEHTTWGTIIQDISIELAAYGDRLELKKATGTDGDDGTISAGGEVDLRPDEDFPFQVAGELIGMKIVNHDDLASEVDAKFSVSGTVRDMEVLGDVRFGPTTVILRPDRSAQIIELAVFERNGEEIQAATPPSPELGGAVVRLNVSVEVPGRVVILATDLRTEWRGNLKIGGTLQSPTLEGDLRTVNGRISVLGRRFVIDDDESVIVFDAATSPPAPYFNIAATASREGITARLVVRGTLKEMELSLTSDPALPTDEILSLLLFGRNVTEISPVQALQLIRAAALFSGTVEGLPFLSGPSRMRGIDTFDVKMAEGSPVVGVGKYLADGVFLELEQGVGVESSRVRVEIDLLPTLKLESSVGADALGGLGLFWKWDH